jgi:hypothetical protein
MTAVAERSLAPLPSPALARLARRPARLSRSLAVTTLFAAVNATAFMIVRPGVNDLWAARARASAVSHGVGLTYWFSWFAGGSTPGNYSVLTPYLCAAISAELVGALAAVSITLLTAVAVRGTAHPVAATAIATVAAAINLWSGRVPFLFGTAVAIAAVIAVRRQRPVTAALVAVVCILSSPVSAAFLALGLVGGLVAAPQYRKISATTIATVVLGFGLLALAFGAPGPQTVSWTLLAEAIGALLLFLLARPLESVRAVIWLSMLTALAMALVPNGMGSNFGRMMWFCLPVAVVATSRRRVWIAVLLICPVLISGANLTVTDLRDASTPVASSWYYRPLTHELDRISGLTSYRLEVVAEGAHAAYAALLNHAMLARGWETQEDNALNGTLMSRSLNPTSYKVWLDNNSVGYVALPRDNVESFPEYGLVSTGNLAYLTQVWSSPQWVLYRVADPIPIVAAPEQVLAYSQANLTIRSSCHCTFSVRVRYSKYLRADPLRRPDRGPTTDPVRRTVQTATVTSDGFGYTRMTTAGPGDYILHGSVAEIFH